MFEYSMEMFGNSNMDMLYRKLALEKATGMPATINGVCCLGRS